MLPADNGFKPVGVRSAFLWSVWALALMPIASCMPI